MSKKMTDKERWTKLQEQKQKVEDSIRKAENYAKELDKVKIVPISDPLKQPPKRRILTGTALDGLLSRRGGIEEGRSVELYGQFGTGKTMICSTLAVEANDLIIYIDNEHTFSSDRFIEIAELRGKDPDDINDRLLLYSPNDWIEAEATVRQLPEFDNDGNFIDVGIVIVDSIMKFWAETREFYGRENLTQRQQLIRAQLADLCAYVRRHGAVLVYTNQVYVEPVDTSFKSVEDIFKARGGATLEHIGDYRILLRKAPRNVRFARLVDAIDLPLIEMPFVLTDKGIYDIDSPAERLRALESADKYGMKFLSEKLYTKDPAKKYYKQALRLGMITEETVLEKKWLTEKDIEEVKRDIAEDLDERMEKHGEVFDIDQMLAEDESEE